MGEEIYNTLYESLAPKIGEPLKPILAIIKEVDDTKKEKEEVAEDENKILVLEKRVGNCLETHQRALLDYFGWSDKLSDDRLGDMGRREPDDDMKTPGKFGRGRKKSKNSRKIKD